MSDRPSGVAPIIPIFDWAGAAINDPTALDPARIQDLVIELVASEVPSALARANAIVAGWRKRYGQAEYEEIKQRLLEKVPEFVSDPPKAEELRQRMSQLLDRAGT